MFNFYFYFLKYRSDLLKNQLRKEQLETEIQILENKANIKRQELRNTLSHSSTDDYQQINKPIQTVTSSKQRPTVMTIKNSNYKYDDVS